MIATHRVFGPLAAGEVGADTGAQRDGKQLDLDLGPRPTGRALHRIHPEIEDLVQLVYFGGDVGARDFALRISLIGNLGRC